MGEYGIMIASFRYYLQMRLFGIMRSFFARRPLAANVASYGTLSVGAEFTQQLIIRRFDEDQRGKPYDWPLLGRLISITSQCCNHNLFAKNLCVNGFICFCIRYAVYSMGLAGPGLFFWFRWLDAKFVGTTLPIVLKKAVSDQLISSTGCTVVFYICELNLKYFLKKNYFFRIEQIYE